MDQNKYKYHLENLEVMDPDYVVDVLDISSQELLDKFPEKAKAFIEDEFGEEEDNINQLVIDDRGY